jgi:hypothetical protein
MMRRRRSVVAALLVCAAWSTAAHAQTIGAGVKGGVAISGIPNSGQVLDVIVGRTSAESTSRVGLGVGGHARFPITDRIAFQPELLFVMKGVKLDEVDGTSASLRINYFEFPLLAHITFPVSGYEAVPFLVAGPSFGVRAGSRITSDAPGGIDQDLSETLKTLDMGLAVGGGFERGKYSLEVRFTAGLTDIAQNAVPHTDSLRNRAFLVMAGLKLH